ncbi:Transmembrane protein 132C [Dissostichus eleginoides]|uniref:Transmembrane protein 132C n=1 Tax=Dissostichus eleginoides TaxID=100907 RepID=A0AAD9BY36_DISEL|nr:Transmembrane protein 132C [Dissostichus eleginoides]
MGVQRVLQVDLKMESFPAPLGSRWMAWQVEYPSSRAATQEAETEIKLAQEDLAGIVPLAMLRGETSQSMLKASVDTTARWFCSRSQVMGSAMGDTSGRAATTF